MVLTPSTAVHVICAARREDSARRCYSLLAVDDDIGHNGIIQHHRYVPPICHHHDDCYVYIPPGTVQRYRYSSTGYFISINDDNIIVVCEIRFFGVATRGIVPTAGKMSVKHGNGASSMHSWHSFGTNTQHVVQQHEYPVVQQLCVRPLCVVCARADACDFFQNKKNRG